MLPVESSAIEAPELSRLVNFTFLTFTNCPCIAFVIWFTVTSLGVTVLPVLIVTTSVATLGTTSNKSW